MSQVVGATRTSSPSRSMRSRPGTICVPGAVTVLPFTATRPWAMISSAARREAIPERARNACRRTGSPRSTDRGRCGIGLRRVYPGFEGLPPREHHRQLLRARQVVQAAEAEVLEKVGGGTVQQRAPQVLGTPHDLDQPALLEGLEHRAGAD